jgi:uncharacterized protein (TIGR02145 family)
MNKMTKIIRILLLTLMSHVLLAQEYVAVLEFDGSGMSKVEARNITERFSYELSQTRKFNIIERQQLDLILDEQKTQLSGCVADECAVQIGELAGARFVIAGSVTKTFGLYGIAVRLIDVESGEIVTHILESDEADVQKFVSQRVRNAALRMAAEGGSTNGLSSSSGITVSSGEKGSVVFALDRPGAAVYVDNAYTTQASSQTVSLNLTDGTHQIKFTLPGQQDWVKQLNVLAGETLNYEVTFESGTGSGGVAIDYGIVMVRSDPTGAIAYLDGVELGPTPAQNTKVGVGKHLIRVEKPLYHSYAEEISITSDGIEQIQANLKPRFGRLVIKSVPPGAVVQLNGQQKGRTPVDLPELPSGDYLITVSKDLYHDSEEKYTITDGSNNERTVVLHPAFGQLSVEVNPIGADVFVDGQFKGEAPIIMDELPSGTFRLKLTQDLYETLDEEITIEDGKTNKQFVVLTPRFGTLIITGSPESAEVSINGIAVGKLPLINHRVSTGLAEIKISLKDYHEHEQFIQVDVNGMYPVNVDLVRHSGTIVAISDPPEAMLRLDGVELGPSPQILKQIPTGQHSLVFAHPAFLEEVRDFNLELDERKEISLKLVTYEGSIQQDIDRFAWYRNLSLVGSGGFALGSLALKLTSSGTYDDYKAATDSDQAVELFENANSLNQLSGIALGLAAVALAPALYFQLDISEQKQHLGVVLHTPVSNVDQINEYSLAGESFTQKVGEVINNMDEAQFHPIRRGWNHDYGFTIGGGGILNTFEYLRSLLSFEAFQKLVPMDVYVSGPHSKSELILNNEYSFGHYNPEFVRYFQASVTQLLKRESFVSTTRNILIRHGIIEKLERLQHIYNYISKNESEFEEFVGQYETMLMNKTLPSNGYRLLVPKSLDNDDYWNWAEGNYNFWIRRYIDGTMPVWIEIINTIVNSYKNDIATVTDIDGNAYRTIKIGKQVWMAENLRVTHYRNGEEIPKLSSGISWRAIGISGLSKKGVYCSYDNNERNVDRYGYLYNGHAVKDSRQLAPEGWHVATEEDWQELELYVGMNDLAIDSTGYRGSNQGSQLSGIKALWSDGSLENSTLFGSSGFMALPGGGREKSGQYRYIGEGSLFWSATRITDYALWMRAVSNDEIGIYRGEADMWAGMSIRCVKD